MKLTQQLVVSTALDVVEQDGLQGLNMRAVAKRLDVRQSSLYWHVPSREKLLGLMVAALYRQALAGTVKSDEWRTWLTGFAHSFRSVLRNHRDASKLLALSRPAFEDNDGEIAALVAQLTARGVPAALALKIEVSVIAQVVGWAVIENNEPMKLSIEADATFQAGLDAMLTGFEHAD